MIATPAVATIIENQVALRTGSRRINQPNTAARNGAEANRNIALATVVV